MLSPDFHSRLRAIDWSRLTHAYGSAADVPERIAQLLSHDEDERADAQNDFLFASIWHQGTVYEASAPAVPFLIEMIADPSVPDRATIVTALGLIAEATSTRAAVRRGLPVYLALLDDPDRPLRAATMWVLAHFPEDAAVIAPRLGEAPLDQLVRHALRAHAHVDGERPCRECYARWTSIREVAERG